MSATNKNEGEKGEDHDNYDRDNQTDHDKFDNDDYIDYNEEGIDRCQFAMSN